MWGEGAGGSLPSATPVEVTGEAKARYQNVPAEILDQLPDNVRSALDAHFGVNDGALNSQQLDWWCLLRCCLYRSPSAISLREGEKELAAV